MGFSFDPRQLLHTFRTNPAALVLAIAILGFIVFLVISGIRDYTKEGRCPRCEKLHVFREVSSTETGRESGSKDEWDYATKRWERVSKTTIRYRVVYTCSSCGFSETYSRSSTTDEE